MRERKYLCFCIKQITENMCVGNKCVLELKTEERMYVALEFHREQKEMYLCKQKLKLCKINVQFVVRHMSYGFYKLLLAANEK